MTKYFCDICGQEIDTNSYYSINYVECTRGPFGGFMAKVNPFGSMMQKVVSCEHCWNEFLHKEKGESK